MPDYLLLLIILVETTPLKKSQIENETTHGGSNKRVMDDNARWDRQTDPQTDIATIRLWHQG